MHERAFGRPDEADLVDAVRHTESFLPELSLAAWDVDHLVGHILFSGAQLEAGAPVLALAPMAVLPDRQRRGIGSLLVEAGLERARATEFQLVVVLGHPEYYPRFGFVPAARYGILAPFPVPGEAWMAVPLPSYQRCARGRVVYPAAFGELL
ncbi:MAG: N-acetyltransferase [Actinomycetota bacterium]|nr:N-acetyltransferase [Actinomycetota bacterium]